MACVCVCGRRCIVGRLGLQRLFSFFKGDGVMYECVCSLMRMHIRLAQPPALSLDISLPKRGLTDTYTYTKSSGAHSGHLARPVRMFFHFVRPVDPNRRRRQAGISITSCHCCSTALGGLLSYGEHTAPHTRRDSLCAFSFFP